MFRACVLSQYLVETPHEFEWMEFGGGRWGHPYVLWHPTAASGGCCYIAYAYLIAREPEVGRDLGYWASVKNAGDPEWPADHFSKPVYLCDERCLEPNWPKDWHNRSRGDGLWCSLRFDFSETPERIKQMVAEANALLRTALEERKKSA